MEENKEVGQQSDMQEPEMKQVEVAPTSNGQSPKAGHNKTVLSICIAVVVVLGLWALVITIIGKVSSDEVSSRSKDRDSSKTEKEDEPKDDEEEDDDDTGKVDIKKEIKPVSLDGGVDDDRIQALFKAVEDKINEAKIELGELKVYKDYPVPYSYKSGYATWLDRGYGLQTRFVSIDGDDSVNYGSVEERQKIHEVVFNKVLSEAGFFMSDNLDSVEGLGGDYFAFLDSNGYFCEYQDQEIDLVCGNTSWLSKEKQDLVTELTDAMYVGHEADRAKDGVILIRASKEDIEDSEVKPYQRLHASSLTGGLWYYRNSPNDKWVFVYGGNGGVPYCTDINVNDDMRKAYEGDSLPCMEK